MSSYMKTHAQPLLAYLHLWYLRALALAWDLTLDGISDEKNWLSRRFILIPYRFQFQVSVLWDDVVPCSVMYHSGGFPGFLAG
ncbi:hypothetical protein BKA61DRAFT_193132 [Leptodontidium sp. MPI-SDFR-AT-0119]|nr:hypothetical protein BKA61DRAFT_193132 [Leptodontidium sp. MPI-SDFR-AT-0119]